MSTAMVAQLKAAGQDYEWYPTTPGMIAACLEHLEADTESILDIGAGDGRVLLALAEKCQRADLYSIERSSVLQQVQPGNIIPVGAAMEDQNLSCLRVDYIFCNPPYSVFEAWAAQIIDEGYARMAHLVLPRRWRESRGIRDALKRRGAVARTIHEDDFYDAERAARAVVDVVEILYPRDYHDCPTDPFDIWFDANIENFEKPSHFDEDLTTTALARRYSEASIGELVAAYNEEYERMEANYRAIFHLDKALLLELGVSKDNVREGLKTRMAGLKAKYWKLLFGRLDVITKRLTTASQRKFLERLLARNEVAFSVNNAYAVIIWAVKNANLYYDTQLIQLFRDLSTFEGASNYKSNVKTWQKHGWRYSAQDHDHYALDYRVVVAGSRAIKTPEHYAYQFPGNLYEGCHELLVDIAAVFGNLGYSCRPLDSRERQWVAGRWQSFELSDGRVLFQVKAYRNGNLHLRFLPEAIRRLNIEAGRLLGWLQSAEQAAEELGYDVEEVCEAFHSNIRLVAGSIALLTGSTEEACHAPESVGEQC